MNYLDRLFVSVIAMMAVTVTPGCSNEEQLGMEGVADATAPLNISVSNSLETKVGGVISGAAFPANSSLGLFLTKTADDATYDTPYNNIQYTSSTSGGNQIWTATTPILLTGTKANVYAYYPYDPTYTNITAIPINVTENKDVMWATPATNIYNANPTAPLAMNHALSVIRFSLSKGDYSGAGSIESISIQGDCMAKTGTLNVKTGDVTISDQGAEIGFGSLGAAANLSPTATTVEQLVIPTTTNGPIKVTIKMDGKTFEATSSATVSTEKSKAYKFGLAFSDGKLQMSAVSICTIAQTEVGDFTPVLRGVPTITWAEAKSTDGVYGIYEGKPVLYSEAETADNLNGVAIVMYGRALQISNIELERQPWGYYHYYDPEVDGDEDEWFDIEGIPDLTECGGGVNGYHICGYLPKSDGTYETSEYSKQIRNGYLQWHTPYNAALSDTAGWCNTEALIDEQGNYYLGGATKAFRNNSEYKDWFIPACGQMTYIYFLRFKINTLLSKCTDATMINTNICYWSSSECDQGNAWEVVFSFGMVRFSSYGTYSGVRFCRDITE